jgi:hypothetical protein
MPRSVTISWNHEDAEYRNYHAIVLMQRKSKIPLGPLGEETDPFVISRLEVGDFCYLFSDMDL